MWVVEGTRVRLLVQKKSKGPREASSPKGAKKLTEGASSSNDNIDVDFVRAEVL